ncbi:MAG: class I SAM-dependent methyltransferase [Geopsychrobacter sp.]|nr:class I SAM-dependent methyltransferase [Geopsychrobacter sp.]
MKFYRKIVARFYDLAMQRVERLCLQQWRRELLAELSGDVLEIGAGTGANLTHYSSRLASLQLCEPDAAMRRQLEVKLGASSHGFAHLSACVAARLDVDGESLDFVVSTLAFCSVEDPEQAMREAFRVLKPGGRLVLMEHVAADQNSRLHYWQHCWQPFWKRIACNCHLTRKTAQLLEDSGFELFVRKEVMRGAPAITTPMIVGYALRP